MSFKKLALVLISTGYLAAAATLGQRSPAQEETQIDASLAKMLAETVVETFPINSTSSALGQRDEEGGSKLSKRADCWNGGSINTDDIQNLGNSRQGAGGNNYVPAASGISWTLGSARVCVLNNYLFDNTHVSDWEIGWGILAVRNDCCYTPYCGGGLQQGHGDSGLAVNIVVRSAGEGC